MADLNKNTINIKFDEDEVNKIIIPIQTEAERLINKLDKVLAIQSNILFNQPIKTIALDGTKISKNIEDKMIKNNVTHDKKKDAINVIDELKAYLQHRYRYCVNREENDSRYRDEAHGYLMTLKRIDELEAEHKNKQA